MFKVQELSVSFDKTAVLKNVSFHITPGESVVLIGQNGAGKSTLCECLLGIIPNLHPAKLDGRVLVGGSPTTAKALYQIGRRVGFTLEDPEAQFVALSVAEEVTLTLAAHGREASEKTVRLALESFGISELLGRDPKTLSEGEKRRVTLAALEGAQPEAMVLDDPTAALDASGQVAFLKFVDRSKQRGCTTLFSTHNMEVAVQAAQRYLGLNRGRLLADRCVPTSVNELVSGELFAGINDPLSPPPDEIFSEKVGDIVLEARGLAFSYPRGRRELFRDISIKLGSHEVLVLRGENGSGKTTLLYTLAGLLRPTKGTVRISGVPPRDIPTKSRAEFCGFVFQNPEHQIFMHRAAEEVLSGVPIAKRTDPKLTERLEWMQSAVSSIPDMDKDPHTLSMGQKKTLTLMTALLPRPRLLLLDEPELGLDPVQKIKVARMLRTIQEHWRMAMVIITHDENITQGLTGAKVLDLSSHS